MTTNPQELDVPVEGGTLRVLRFGEGPRVVVAAHGITGSGMSFRAVARHLPPQWSLLAVDLRGRGGSAAVPGPYGMRRHGDDLGRVVEQVAPGSAVTLVGHSMGAYAALRTAVARPELIDRLVLVDGGLPLPVPEGADLDQVLNATLGPAIERLTRSFPSEQAYVDLFRTHPALAESWNPDLEAYARYDLVGGAGGFGSRVQESAVRTDGRDLLEDPSSFGEDLIALSVPTILLAAPSGMFGQPPGILPQPLVEHWRQQCPALVAEVVADTNHYTILMGDSGAARTAARIADGASWPAA